MASSPAFQFYVNEWLGSTNITLMSPAEEGAYIRLLAIAWNDPDCSLPDDDAHLAVLSRLGKQWNKSKELIRRCFVPHPTAAGRLVNLRLMMEREKQKEWREKSAAAGRKSAAQKAKGGARLVEPPLKVGSTNDQPGRLTNGSNQMPTLLSSSSSSSSEKTDRQTDTRGRGEPAGEVPDRSLLLEAFARLLNRPQTAINWGPIVTWLETVIGDGQVALAWKCLQNALESSTAAPHTSQAAVKYVSAIYERCRHHECEPGQFPTGDSGGQTGNATSRAQANLSKLLAETSTEIAGKK